MEFWRKTYSIGINPGLFQVTMRKSIISVVTKDRVIDKALKH